MSRRLRSPHVGQWYMRRDTREVFQVTGLDEHSQAVEIQTSDGDLDEIELTLWRVMPLVLAEPPEDWSEPADVPVDDLEFPPSGVAYAAGSSRADERFGAPQEAWEDTATEEEIDLHTWRVNPDEPL